MITKKKLNKRISELEHKVKIYNIEFNTLVEKIRELEMELSRDIEVRKNDIARVTTKGSISAIAKYLGISIEANPGKVVPPSTKVKKLKAGKK